MKKFLMICAAAFLLGLIIIIVLSVVHIFWVNEAMMLWGLRAGLVLIGISTIVLITILSLERVKDSKKFKNEIEEKDLRP